MTNVVLTVIGTDRPGLVSALAAAVAGNGGNWLESRLARLAGKFAGIVLVDAPEDAIDALGADLDRLGDSVHLAVSVTRTDAEETAEVFEPTTSAGPRLVLSLVGDDQPGIVRDITEAMAGRGVTIDEFTSTTSDAPMHGGQLFRADAVVRLPDSVDVDQLIGLLEGVATHLMVDLEIAPEEPQDA
ncbi:glycine cleavage system protein R [Nigerium massiliense]|uniref:glycine cleavage system protein R n=1 Tax=Nigerium massiliense TaxID=1522317 RepID=UPI000590509E|nr:ACT domain-containing protein [Nigerium massiliense]